MSDDQSLMAKGEYLLGKSGTPKRSLHISLTEYRGTPLLDLRYYYTDKEGNDKPTPKGISITKDKYMHMHDVLEQHHDHVLDYLGNGFTSSNLADIERLKASHRRKLSSVNEIRVEFLAIAGLVDAFRVEYQSSLAIVRFNLNHEFGLRVSDISSECIGAVELISKMVVALDLSMLTNSEAIDEFQDLMKFVLNDYSRNLKKIVNI